MAQQLIEAINKVVLLEGHRGWARLSLAAGKSVRMIDRYRRGLSKPAPETVAALAVECGFSQEDAAKMAEESQVSHRTAS